MVQTATNTGSKHFGQPVTAILFALLVLLSLGTFVVAVDLIWQVRQWNSAWVAGPAPKDSDEKAKRLEEKLADYSKRADDIRTLVAYVLGLSSLYSIALGVSSYLGVQHAVNQAKDSSDDVREMKGKAEKALDALSGALNEAKTGALSQAREAVNEIRSQYLLIGRVDAAINDILHELNRLLPLFDDSEVVLTRLPPEDRQGVYFYERAVASLELFDLKYSARQASEMFDRLGRFYGLKYVSDRKNTAVTQNPDDLERSRFYLNRAIKKDGSYACALNDRAFLAVEGDVPEDFDLARKLLNISLNADRDQQRARYNLAVIAHKQEKYLEAEGLLTEAIALKRWEVDALPKRIVDLYYNRACARCRLAQPQKGASRKALLDQALGDLKVVFQNRTLWNEAEMQKSIADDRKQDGDLQTLEESPDHRTEFETVMKQL